MTQEKKTSRSLKRTAATLLLTLTFMTSGAAAFAADPADPTTGADAVASASTVGNTVPTLLFSDVASGFWAEKHIYKLASEGIILGDNGKFRPGDSVTQQEAITLALRFMNVTDQLTADAKAPDKLEVSAYFKPYIALAVKEKLINPDEEAAATAAGEAWGTKKASREWVAKILVRALGREDEAKSAAGKGTTFADNATISAAARGYVNVAVSLELTNGVDGNRFDPLGTVTRAQIATFLSRGQAYVNQSYDNVYEGVVTSIGNGKMTLYTNGASRSFTLDSRTAYFTSASETKAAQSDVVLYSKAMVIDKVGTAAYVEITDPTPQLETVEGTLLSSLSGSRLLLLVNGEPVTFTYDNATVFYDQNGQTIKPDSLSNDSTIELKRETFTADKKPVIVQVKSGIVNKSSKGTVESVDTSSKTITVKEESGNEDKLVLNSTVKILYQGQVMELADLKPGSVVTYTIKDNSLISLEVTQSVERTISGSLISLGNGKLLTYKKSDGSYGTPLPISQNVQVVVDGIAAPSLSDLIADDNGGDQVQLTLNANGEVTKIEVLGRQAEKLSEVSVVSYDKTRKLLTVVDTDNNPYVLELDGKTAVEYNSTAPTLSGLEALLNTDRKITLTHIGKRVLSVSVIYQYEGNFVGFDSASKKLKLTDSAGKTRELAFTNASLPVYIYGQASATLSSLKAGDPITAVLSSNQDVVQSINVKTTKQFEIKAVDTTNSRITAVSDNLTQTFYVNQATLLNANGAVIKVTDLKAGDFINVLFSGSTAANVQQVKLTYGAVTQADASSVTLKTFDGSVTTIPAAGAVKVVRDSGTSTSLTALTTSDHVVVKKAADGSTLVTVLTPLERTYWRYDSVSKEVYVKRSTLSDTNIRFSVGANPYIHQGDTTLTVQSLQENDNIVLYFDGDKLVEIVKQ
ncbi:S-layer protein [Paenibacillus yonginensis]|uniref:S-layer protein n=1 Tax=Paenibacillus yonginensis TaxID=1462996 RepID=A0A1B1N042_9BACL|nr:S-layer homology domain-containing protein [Paenibacillus yonginensis]ANS74794.1 S-layer protein [Paenibacillus yonginensis]